MRVALLAVFLAVGCSGQSVGIGGWLRSSWGGKLGFSTTTMFYPGLVETVIPLDPEDAWVSWSRWWLGDYAPTLPPVVTETLERVIMRGIVAVDGVQ